MMRVATVVGVAVAVMSAADAAVEYDDSSVEGEDTGGREGP